MEATDSNTPLGTSDQGPAWKCWLGIVTIVLGLLLTVSHGNEAMIQVVAAPDSAAVQDKPLKCREDELIEEGLSLMECQLMATTMKNLIVSSPDWFRCFQMTLMAIGTVIAALSVFIGIALFDNRSWASKLAVFTFASLLAIDVIEFIAVVNTGPLLRAHYLWNVFLWFVLHLMLTSAAFVGLQAESKAAQS